MRLAWWFSVVALVLALPVAAQKTADKNKGRAPVVAIFPFKVLNQDPKLVHLGEGAAEAVINKVVNDKALRIVEESQLDKAVNTLARNQNGMFEEESYLEIGKMVDARFIVIGSVQVVENQVAVTARLLEVETRQLLTATQRLAVLVLNLQLPPSGNIVEHRADAGATTVGSQFDNCWLAPFGNARKTNVH